MEVQCARQRFSYGSVKAPTRKSGELDFNDVFGGPPRRFSMQEVRGGNCFSESSSEEDRLSPLASAVKEKPVFGEETAARTRNSSSDFFDDIFRGDKSYRSTRSRDRDNLFGRSPNSVILSSKTESFGTSPLSQFSSYYKMDGSINALISPRSTAPLSRFSNQANRREDEVRNEARLHRQSSLPCEACFKYEDLPYNIMSNEKETAEISKKDMKSIDDNGKWFHSSIYKWAAGKGILLIKPLTSRKSMKSKNKIGKCESFDGRIESKPSITGNGGLSVHTESEHVEVESEKGYLGSSGAEKEQKISVEDGVLNAEYASGGARQNITLERSVSHGEIDMVKKIVKEVPVPMKESLKCEVKPTLGSLLFDYVKRKGSIVYKEETKTATPKKSQSDVSIASKNEGMSTDINSKPGSHDVAIDPELNPGKIGAMGKVREYVKIFNQEADSRPNADVHAQNGSYRWKAKRIDKKEKLCENLKKDEAQLCNRRKKTPIIESDSLFANQNTASSTESFPWDSTASVENSDCSFEDNFMVEELSDDLEEVTLGSEGSEHIKSLDAKIQQWYMGRKGNIRSLLSTLQYVLWPGSGWNPVPLVDLMEANSVKRAYQKALLRLHPDKLQQRGAASHQKYTAEKIFDILQEAWSYFNTLTPL